MRRTRRCTASSPATASRRPASTSRSPASARCGTSRTARWPPARSRPSPSRRRPAGTSCRRRSCATARTASGCASSGSTSSRRSTSRSLARSGVEPLRRMAVFDAVINNADRKGGHLLPLPDGHVYGVDHGVCFSVEDKLRTLLWGWQGKRLTEEAVGGPARAEGRPRRRARSRPRRAAQQGRGVGDQAPGRPAALDRSAPRAARRLAPRALAALLRAAHFYRAAFLGRPIPTEPPI